MRGWFDDHLRHRLARLRAGAPRNVKAVRSVDTLPQNALAGYQDGEVYVSREVLEKHREHLDAVLTHEYAHAKWEELSSAVKKLWVLVLRGEGFRPEKYGYPTEEDMAEEAYAFRREYRRYWGRNGKSMPSRFQEPLFADLREKELI